ncbi:hypothetical protein L6164_006453 [Bauhinia variegata]|uniref:Uncharacterized protein n=1 Tax=Bauhinia variegata TaxID=167791 RepID=A0ACB9PUK6_BAUVA|nr:hypothetical protein L6164_006453 [Bauhinia variegata]
MEPSRISPRSAAGNGGKLRLMCSYGGHIVPRPGSKSLCYVGGETRIVAIDPRTVTSLSSFVAHLSSTLSINFSFIIKYQLPRLDLCSLISVTSDDDFQILIEEHQRLSCSPFPVASRIRVFLFPSKPDSGLCLIRHPKSETWFSDALKGVKVMQKGRHCLMGFDGEAGSGVEAHSFLSSGPESMVLETSSSFGSTSSSASLSNLPPLRCQGEDNEVNSQDAKVKLTPADTVPSENTASNILSHHQKIVYQDPAVHASPLETKLNAESVELETVVPNISSGIIVNNTNMNTGYASFSQLNQMQRQPVQFVQAGGAHFIPHNPTDLSSLPYYPQTYRPQQPLQLLVHHPHQPYPIYLVPIPQRPPNNLPSQFGVTDTATASSQASWHLVHNFEEPVKSALPPDILSQNYHTHTSNAAMSNVHVTNNGTQQHEADLLSAYQHPPSLAIACSDSAKQGNDPDDYLARVQIYKSQPPPPSLPSQYQSMTARATMLSEDFV